MGNFYYNPNPDELYHWKYKYKKMINGKMRYFYDIGKLNDDDKEGTEETEASYSGFEDWLGKDERDSYVRAVERESKLENDMINGKNVLVKGEAAIKLAKHREKNQDAAERFASTPLGALAQFERAARYATAWIATRPTGLLAYGISKLNKSDYPSRTVDVLQAVTEHIGNKIYGDGKSSYERLKRTKKTTDYKRRNY